MRRPGKPQNSNQDSNGQSTKARSVPASPLTRPRTLTKAAINMVNAGTTTAAVLSAFGAIVNAYSENSLSSDISGTASENSILESSSDASTTTVRNSVAPQNASTSASPPESTAAQS